VVALRGPRISIVRKRAHAPPRYAKPCIIRGCITQVSDPLRGPRRLRFTIQLAIVKATFSITGTSR
jgi:hypothetical protein